MAKNKTTDAKGAPQKQQSAYARILDMVQQGSGNTARKPQRSAYERMSELAGRRTGTMPSASATDVKPQSAYQRMRELAGRNGNNVRSDQGIAPYGEQRQSAYERMKELAGRNKAEQPNTETREPLNQYQLALMSYGRQARDYGRQQEQAAKEDPAYGLALRFSETELLDKIAQAQGAAKSAKKNYEYRRQTEQIGLYNNRQENAEGARARLNASHRASTERDREAEQLRVALQIRRDMDARGQRGEYEREILGSPGYSDELARKGLEFIAEQSQKDRMPFEGQPDIPDAKLYQDYMTEDERRVFGYLTAMDMHYAEFPASGVHYEAWTPGSHSWFKGMYAGGRSAAYIRSLHDELIERMNAKDARERFVPQESDSFLEKAGKVLDYGAASLNEGIGRGVEGLANAFNPNYQGYHTPQQELLGYAQAAVEQDHPGSFGARLYRDLGGAAQSIGQMLPAMAAGYGAGAAIGMLGTGVAGTGALSATNVGATAAAASTAAQRAAFFLSIKGNAYAEGREKGLNENQAQIYSTINALSETSLESLIGGIAGFGGISEQALGLRVNRIRNAFGRTAAHLALNASGELLEENLQDIIDPIVLSMITGKQHDLPTLSDLLDTSIATIMMLSGTNAVETGKYAYQTKVRSNLLKIAEQAQELAKNDAAYQRLSDNVRNFVDEVDRNPDTMKFTKQDTLAALSWKTWLDLSKDGGQNAQNVQQNAQDDQQNVAADSRRYGDAGRDNGLGVNPEFRQNMQERDAAAAQDSVPYEVAADSRRYGEEEATRDAGGGVPYEVESPQFAEIEAMMYDTAVEEAGNYGAERIEREIRDAEDELAKTVSGSDTEAILRGRIRGLTDALNERTGAKAGDTSSALRAPSPQGEGGPLPAQRATSPEGGGFDNGLGVNPEFRQDGNVLAADSRRYGDAGRDNGLGVNPEFRQDVAADSRRYGDAEAKRDAAAAQNSVPYENERSLNNGTEEGFDDRGERNEGLGAGRPAGELEGGTGGSVARGEARKSDAGRKARIAALRADQSARDIGVNGGSDKKTLRLIEDRALYTSAMERIDAEARAMGAQVSFVKGRLEVKNPETGKYESVAAIRQPGENGTRFFVRADARIYNEEQLFKHERMHELLANDPTLRSEILAYMKQSYSQEELVRITEAYIEAYKGIYGTDDAALDKYLEEMLCDAYADMQRGRADNRIGRETVAEFGERIEGTRNKAPPTEGTGTRYSFAGEHAENAPRLSLENAKQMLENGTDSETVRRETGWFKGLDGKWRFEINDSDANVMIPRRYARLENVLQHDALFEAYPALREIGVFMEEMKNGINGSYNRSFDGISINRELTGHPEEFKSTLLHEIQHVIQNWEGFAKGANREYWERRTREGRDTRTVEERKNAQELQRRYNDWAKQDPQFVRDMEALDKETPTVPRGSVLNWDTLESEPDPPEWVAYDEKREALEEKYGLENVWDFIDLQYKLGQAEKNRGKLTPSDLYYQTAGEIEARDTAKRRDLSDEQRKNTRPDIDREDVVFAEDGWIEANDYDEKNDTIKKQIARSQDKLNRMQVAATITAPAKFSSSQAAAKWAISELAKTGYAIENKEHGILHFDPKSMMEGSRYAHTDAERAAFVAIPAVSKRGITIAEHNNHDNRKKKTFTLAAPVILNGVRGNMAITFNLHGNKYYAHRILMPDGTAFVLKNENDTANGMSRGVTENGSLAKTTNAVSESIINDSESKSKPKKTETQSQFSMDADEDDDSLGVFDPGAVEEYEQFRRREKASRAKEYRPKSTKVDNGLRVNPEFRYDVAADSRRYGDAGRDNGLGVNPEFRQDVAADSRRYGDAGRDNGLGVNPEFRQDTVTGRDASAARKGVPYEAAVQKAREKKIGNAKKASELTLKTRIREREQELRELDRMKDGGYWNDTLEARRAAMLETLELEKAELARKVEERKQENAPAKKLRKQIESAEAELRALNTAERSGGLSEEQQQRRQELTEQIKELNRRLHARQEAQRRKVAELKDAELQKEPPRQAKKEFREDALNLFSIPKEMRAAMGAVLNQFADRVLEKGSVSHEDRQELIRTLYERGVETAPADDYYRAIRQTMKNKRIFVNDQTRAEFGDDWSDFRKRAWGLGIYLTNNANDPGVDVWNQQLADAFPGSFDADNLDMKGILEAITQLAEEGRDQKMTLAEMMERNQQQTGESIDSQMDTLERKVDSLIEKFAEKAELETELRGQSVMRRALERRDMREKAERNAKRRSENIERENLMKKLRTLQRMRSKSDAETRAQIDNVLGDIDTVARSISPRGLEDLQELARIYEEAKEDPNFLGSPYVEKRLDRLRQTQIDDLDISTVTELANTVSALITAIRDRNRLLADERHREISDAAHALNREILDSGGKPGALAKWTANEHLSPTRFLQRLGGWLRGGEAERVSRALEEGQTKRLDYMRQATRLFDGFVKNKNNQEWLQKASGKHAEWIDVTLPAVTEDGKITWKQVSITPMMRVSLYMHGQNNDNLRHIEGGGVTIPDRELYRKGRIKEAYAQGVRVKMLPETVFAVTKDMSRQELAFARLLKQYYDGYSKEKINETSMLLEGFERAGVENYYPIRSSQNFLAKDAETVDPTSKSILQIGSIVNERVHSGNPIILQDASDTLLQHIDQMAKYYGLAFPIRDFNAMYQYTFHDAGEDGQKEAFTGSLKETLDHIWGSGAQEYIDKLLADLQQSNRQSDTLGRLLAMLRGNLAGASLTLNPAVALSQVASLPGAVQTMGWDGVLAAVAKAADIRQRVDMDLIETYTPLLWYRNQGNSTQELGDYMEEQGLAGKLPWLLGWIQKMDTATIKALWYAAEHRVSKDTDLAPGTEAEIKAGTDPYYQEVAKVFNRAIYDTQPNYTVMQRPQILRSESDLTKMLTMYKTVPLQYYNMMYEAAGRLHADKQRLQRNASAENRAAVKTSQKALVNTFSGILAANVVYVAIKALVKNLTFRDKKYRDEEGEYTAASLGGQLGKELLETYAGSFIGGSELMTAGEKLYDAVTTGKYSQYGGIEVSAVSALEDALGTIYNLGTALNMEDPTKGLDALREGALTISSVFGVPARNAETYLKAILKWISPEAAARYENVFDEKDKRDLSGEHGRYLRAALHTLMDNRTEGLDAETIDELVRLWGEGGNGAIPSALPSSFKVSVDGESTDYKLGFRDRNTYRETWSYTVSDALSELIGTELYRNSTDEEKTKLIHKLYDYAGQTAKSAVSENAAPDRWVNTGWSAVLSGVPLAEYVCYDSQAKALDAKDDAGESVSGLKNSRNLELIRVTGWTDEQQEQIYLASTITSDALREKEQTIRKAGFSWPQTAEVLAVVGSNWDHAKQIIDTKIDTRAKVKALSLYLGENDYKAVKAGQIYRMDLKLWADAKDKADTNGKGGVSQEEATAYIDKLKINLEEKAYLWQMLCPGSKSKNNPYSTTMGQSIWEYMQTVVKP